MIISNYSNPSRERKADLHNATAKADMRDKAIALANEMHKTEQRLRKQGRLHKFVIGGTIIETTNPERWRKTYGISQEWMHTNNVSKRKYEKPWYSHEQWQKNLVKEQRNRMTAKECAEKMPFHIKVTQVQYIWRTMETDGKRMMTRKTILLRK